MWPLYKANNFTRNDDDTFHNDDDDGDDDDDDDDDDVDDVDDDGGDDDDGGESVGNFFNPLVEKKLWKGRVTAMMKNSIKKFCYKIKKRAPRLFSDEQVSE